jgi:hypothetical protein
MCSITLDQESHYPMPAADAVARNTLRETSLCLQRDRTGDRPSAIGYRPRHLLADSRLPIADSRTASRVSPIEEVC